MKKFIVIIISFLLLSPKVFARIYTVQKNSALSSIQQAINIATNGDTIMVMPGVYAEKNIQVNKSLVLIGKSFPVLDGQHSYEIISIKADNVILEGFKLIHSGISSLIDIAGIKIYARKNVVIKNNILDDTFFGIYLQKAVNCLIENNKLKGVATTDQQSGNGIHCWQCDSLRIIGNTIAGHRDGIYFEFVTNSAIWRNVSHANMRYGLHFMFSHENTYIGNIFKNNNAGVSVMFSHGVKMFNNIFEDNWGDGCYGIFLKEITDSYISGNKFLRNTTGIFMEGATRVLVEKNEFSKNGWAVKIDASCLDDTIRINNFLGNSFDVATNGTLVSSFSYNYWDKYEGYDLNKNNIGDVPYHPVSLFSMIVAENPSAMILFRSIMATMLDKIEKILPGITPENLVDNFPYMKPIHL
ncbi:nitrous oxide reductase family maturation protein NosD [Ginsengibacter hankyongi]|uniref:Nitrous oxide reductase family maturation protein NosD n=1 Tax=Ginsengibacter hankyongi TaxID=2607284 RepID=A0A5J5IE11_9BACT|nr:nitrous oxide reductase family maturation protein NosD [Ginsengibacter hankyongi]KAA9038142.1 nitrous oxide reductase family maturation protein NosD [Ginsengibacter hankyongi]